MTNENDRLHSIIRSEVQDCRDNRNMMLNRFENNIVDRLDQLSSNQIDIKEMLESRLQHHETLASSEDIALRGQVDNKVSSTMFRWALGILVLGLIGGGILNYATLRSVQTSMLKFGNALESHVDDVVIRDEAEEQILRQLIKDAREKHNIPIDPNIYIPKVKPIVPFKKQNEGDN